MPGAMFAAAIFAVHPVKVQSVAWITQLKNTLSLTLVLISAFFYVLHEQKGGRWRYGCRLASSCYPRWPKA